jgi:hypothetical protein
MGTFTYESQKYRFKNLSVDGNLDLLDDGAILKIGNDDDLQITHSGSAGTITNNPGDLTLDVAGDIILDADGADVIFKDAGTTIATLTNSSSDFVITTGVQDKDFIIKGDDNGSPVTALTLDMSEAGAATFNGAITSNAGVIVDNITIDGTEIDLSSGSLTLDVAADINLDAGGSGINFLVDGTQIGAFENDSQDFVIKSNISDKDIIFKGNDGGSTISVFKLDMSEAGAAIFKNDVTAFGSPSDINLKENVKTITGALDKIDQLTGVIFNYKKNGKKSTGLIAQDLQKVLPEVVYTSKDIDTEEEHLAVRYGNIAGLIIEAIKELKKEVETLKESK